MGRRRPLAPEPGPATRVLLISGDLRPGLDGVADYVVRLADELREAGVRVRVLHTGPVSGVRGARSAGTRWGVSALLAAARAARGADVVHVQFAPSMYRFHAGVGILPLVIGRTPLVTTLHEYGWWRFERRLPGIAWRALERLRLGDRETALLVPRSERVLVTNGRHAADVRRRFAGHVPAAVVPIGANVEVEPGSGRADARSSVRAELRLPPDAVLIAFFGFVHPVKGVRYLAEAVAALAGEGRDAHLLVIGGFESLALPADEAAAFERELRGQIADAGAGTRTTITGFLDQAAASRLLAAADVAALPFTAGVTGKSGSLLTVMAHGLPVVVTAGAERDDELDDGLRVVVVPQVRDGAALAAGLRRVLDDPALSARVAAAGAEWAARHDWPGIARRHLQVYAEAVRRP